MFNNNDIDANWIYVALCIIRVKAPIWPKCLVTQNPFSFTFQSCWIFQVWCYGLSSIQVAEESPQENDEISNSSCDWYDLLKNNFKK